MLSYNGHPEIRASAAGFILSTILLWQAEAPEPCLVGAACAFSKQLFPFFARQAIVVPVGAAMLAAMIEEAIVVVLVLQWLYLALDEGIELLKEV